MIIGAGQAAAQACVSLRQYAHDGPITVIGEEAAPPYQRPPLSKGYLKGEMAQDRLWFKPHAWYEDNGIDLILSLAAVSIDRSARRVQLEHGGYVPYDWLILATGSRPRPAPFPGSDNEGVHMLRTLADVERLAPHMVQGRRLVVIGGGYIGLEAAAVARQMGLEVSLVEAAPRVLARVAGHAISAFYAAEHARQGVSVLTGVGVAGIEREAGALAVRLDDGRRLAADLVLIGIGVLPNEDMAREAGLACRSGILTDRDARTGDRRVFACGDCARRPLVHYGRQGRLESVHNALEQARLAAAAITGQPRPAEEVPWFWSDQYDVKLQIAGLSEGHDAAVVRGDPESRRFAVFYLRAGRLIAVDAVNDAPAFLGAKRLIATQPTLAPGLLADTSIPMKEIAALA